MSSPLRAGGGEDKNNDREAIATASRKKLIMDIPHAEAEIKKLRDEITLRQMKAEKALIYLTLKNLADAAQEPYAEERNFFRELLTSPFIIWLLFFSIASGIAIAMGKWFG